MLLHRALRHDVAPEPRMISELETSREGSKYELNKSARLCRKLASPSRSFEREKSDVERYCWIATKLNCLSSLRTSSFSAVRRSIVWPGVYCDVFEHVDGGLLSQLLPFSASGDLLSKSSQSDSCNVSPAEADADAGAKFEELETDEEPTLCFVSMSLDTKWVVRFLQREARTAESG